MNWIRLCVLSIFFTNIAGGQNSNNLKVVLVQNPYTGDRASPEKSGGPEALATGGIEKRLKGLGVSVQTLPEVKLTAAEEKTYGKWSKFGMSNGHLGKMVAKGLENNPLVVGLLANCSSLSGMLAGLQHSGPTPRPLRVGLVFIDAHGDFNTPETTLSGMLGGMPVAVAAGHCLTRMRLQSGLDPALPEKYIVLAGVRDTDPLEQERIDNSLIEMVSVGDIRNLSDNLHQQMRRLSQLTDLIYIHVDMDVLDPKEVPGHPLTVPNGPTSKELGKALEAMFKYEKTVALGIASYPYSADPDKISLQAAYNLVAGAVRGIQSRSKVSAK